MSHWFLTAAVSIIGALTLCCSACGAAGCAVAHHSYSGQLGFGLPPPWNTENPSRRPPFKSHAARGRTSAALHSQLVQRNVDGSASSRRGTSAAAAAAAIATASTGSCSGSSGVVRHRHRAGAAHQPPVPALVYAPSRGWSPTEYNVEPGKDE
ncbi:hypothetical protein EON67_00230 [archaeon]|nr:MAG: hypothetical protein EON67_00230 [archaeon]